MPFIPNTQNYDIDIGINLLKIDDKIVSMVESIGCVFPEYLSDNIYFNSKCSLNYGEILNVFYKLNNGVSPIIVKQSSRGKFVVVSGRHRVCVFIMEQESYIPCIIVQN
jgi:hypothetical protein